MNRLPGSLLFFLFFAITQGAFAKPVPCETVFSGADATVQKCGGVHLVRLSGPPLERAKLLGQLLKGPLTPDVIRYFTHKVSDLVDKKAGFFAAPINLLYNQIVRLLHRGSPPAMTEELDAMAQGMGVDPIVLRRGLSLPDMGVVLQGLGSNPYFHFLPAMGCTSVALPDNDGGFVYGRNLDFAGVGVFDRHPMIISVEPPKGSKELRHLVIGADGVPWSGITGVNEARITFSVHQNFTRDVGLYGVPMIMIGEQVLRFAHNLEEAENILRAFRPANLWTFVITDLKSGQAMAVESSQRHFLVRRSEGQPFVQTNHAMHEDTLAYENADLTVKSNSDYRMNQAFELIKEDRSKIADPALVARILGYQKDIEGRLSGYHDILKAETIQSVIVHAKPAQPMMLYLSMDEAPTSGGRYAAFALDQIFANDRASFEIRDFVRTPKEKRRNQRAIAEAYRIYFDEQRPLEAAALLNDQQTLDAALFRALASYQEERFEDAIHKAEQAMYDSRFADEPRVILQSLETIRLASFIRLGRNEDARSLAQRLLERGPGPAKPQLKRLSELVLRGQKPPSWMLQLRFNFFSGDLNGRNDKFK